MFDLASSGIGKELTGDYSGQIASRGGFKNDANMNIAFYLPKRHEVLYLGHMTEVAITKNYPYPPSHSFVSPLRKFRDSPSIDISVTAWQNPESYRNLMIIQDRMMHAMDFQSNITDSDYRGILLGYIDLDNGDQFRFMFPSFMITDISDYMLGQAENSKITFGGKPDFYIENNYGEWDLIEEQKKIDYSKVKTLEYL